MCVFVQFPAQNNMYVCMYNTHPETLPAVVRPRDAVHQRLSMWNGDDEYMIWEGDDSLKCTPLSII